MGKNLRFNLVLVHYAVGSIHLLEFVTVTFCCFCSKMADANNWLLYSKNV